MGIKKEIEEWKKAFKESQKLTNFFDTSLEFELFEDSDVAKYLEDIVFVNIHSLLEKYDEKIKLPIMIHEHGHHFYKKNSPLLKIFTFGTYSIIHKILYKNKKFEEFIAEKFTKFILKIRYGRRGKEIFRKYEKYFNEEN